ncbi:phosphatidylinositol glycan anchor biosynthesis class U protein [Trichonephila clavipes]|nr:phosphatidylinositol glycan anchor biosynthesis class U protein [Trichonephila clavipes]
MSKPTILRTVCLYALGFIVRFIFLKSSTLTNALGNRVEVSTPITSWKKAIEGVNLWKHGTNPYDSDIFHESPLGLVTYDFILTYFPGWLPVIFAICDVLTAVVLSLVAKIYVNNSMKKEQDEKIPESSEPLLLKSENIAWVPFYVATAYLLSPYSIVSCGGKSTVTFQNMLLAFFMLFTACSNWFFASIILAMLSCHSFYHVTLLIPLAMYVYQIDDKKDRTWKVLKVLGTIATFVAVTIQLIFTFRSVTGSWHFLWCTYGCILSVPDLTPNIGLFWYFFTEIFEHFRVFFLCTFQLNVFVYTTPLAVRLRKEPMFFLLIHLIIITIFKSYPCIGDVGFYFALLPIWSHLFHFMRQRFIVCCVLASCTLLAPTLWHLWIYSGSANANFYFAITLAFNTGQVFLLTDILSAYIKREYYLENGVKYNEDGTLVLMRLQ